MSLPGLEFGPPAWEASTLEKSHLDSLYAGYSEPLLIMSLLHPDLYNINFCYRLANFLYKVIQV
jgi:hypothetical protein